MYEVSAIAVVSVSLFVTLLNSDAIGGDMSLTKALRADRAEEVEAAFSELFRGLAACPDCYDNYVGLSDALVTIVADSSDQNLRAEALQVGDHLLSRRRLANWEPWMEALEREATHLGSGRLGSRGTYWYLRCVGSLGPRVSPTLRESLRTFSKRERGSFVGVYSTIALIRIENPPPENDTEILQLLGDSNASTRMYASHGVSIVGKSCAAWDRELLKMVVTGRPAEAACASQTLCMNGMAPAECVVKLRELLTAANEQVNYFPRRISDGSGPHSAPLAARLIGSLGKQGVECIPNLEACVRGEDFILATAALHALGELSQVSEDAMAIIRRSIVSENREIRFVAMKIIEKHLNSPGSRGGR